MVDSRLCYKIKHLCDLDLFGSYSTGFWSSPCCIVECFTTLGARVVVMASKHDLLFSCGFVSRFGFGE